MLSLFSTNFNTSSHNYCNLDYNSFNNTNCHDEFFSTRKIQKDHEDLVYLYTPQYVERCIVIQNRRAVIEFEVDEAA